MKIDMLIDGAPVSAKSGKTYERIDPFTGEVATVAAAATADDVPGIVASAQEAFEGWSRTGPNARRKILNKAADILESKVDEFTRLIIAETGATGPWAGFNVAFAAGVLREAASMTTQITGEIIPSDKAGSMAMGQRKPLGVCLGMAPWNAPVILGVRAIAMPLACGNSVILKASEACPGTHRLIGDVLAEAGLPKGVLNVVTNAPEDAADLVAALISHDAVKHVNFTGSTAVGRIIGRLAGENLKPVLLELGGKAPLVVLDDADIDGAVNAAVFGAFMNQGQICMSTERIIVDEKIADDFVAKLSARAASLPAGDPRGKVALGALISEAAAEKMDSLVDDAVSKGAKLTAGGARKGAVVPAGVLDGVTPQMRIYREESFGPVKSVIRVNGDDEAVRVANDTEYGLSAAVHGGDLKRAMAVADRIKSGICHINGPTVSDEAQMPFGGVKASGHGRFGGKAGIDAFTDWRWLTIEDPHKQHYPF
ncbi:aldehyde dehydrogenase [Roseinatronobacter alkalisoli]|uniref:Aldehyde dehydrogenase n=1 Tax=Roseinatronobacter alkalisoli TaxID=3028235 RepID=A0ABT5T755_9RHOB|nr:aldehyde dehydrogenase [Roseinatronobacter sp. HJB301]MDD7970942.1 aldehyde dehydrogenase [Roseinatronobacter sp. HJB301]